MEKKTINIVDVINDKSAVSQDDGGKVYDILTRSFSNNEKVILDFKNVELVTSSFLNAAIGQLYSKYESTFMNENMTIKNINSDDDELLKLVIKRAKEYFKKKI